MTIIRPFVALFAFLSTVNGFSSMMPATPTKSSSSLMMQEDDSDVSFSSRRQVLNVGLAAASLFLMNPESASATPTCKFLLDSGSSHTCDM